MVTTGRFPRRTRADMIEAFRPGLAGFGIFIAPDALGGDWTDAKNEQAAVWLTQSAMQTYAIDPKRMIIMGYSMGGEGTWYIGSRHQDVFTAAIPVAAPVAGSTDWKIPVYSIHSEQDEIISHSAAKGHADAIKAKGGKIEFKSVSGLTHYDTPSYATLRGRRGEVAGGAVEVSGLAVRRSTSLTRKRRNARFPSLALQACGLLLPRLVRLPAQTCVHDRRAAHQAGLDHAADGDEDDDQEGQQHSVADAGSFEARGLVSPARL